MHAYIYIYVYVCMYILVITAAFVNINNIASSYFVVIGIKKFENTCSIKYHKLYSSRFTETADYNVWQMVL